MSSEQPLEMILIRQLARHLASPIWILDSEGELVFYNEPAEQLLGIEFSDIGSVASVDLSEMFEVTDVDGEPLAEEELPVIAALTTQSPASRTVMYKARDGIWHTVDIFAMPIVVHGDRFLGVFTAFWEVEA